MRAPCRMPPYLYHEMPKVGTRGGLKPHSPVMEMCGNFNFGRLHSNLKQFLIFSIPCATAERAASIFSENALLILSKVSVTAVLAAFIFDWKRSAMLDSFPSVRVSTKSRPKLFACFVDIHRVHLLTPFLVLQISPPRYSLKLPPVLAACPP